MIKKIWILILYGLLMNDLFAQEREEKLFSDRVKQGVVSGYLVGKYDGPPEAIKYFEFLTLLEADVSLVTKKNNRLKVECIIKPANEGLNTYFIELKFNKQLIKEIGNEQDLTFEFTFYVRGDVTNIVKGGTFRTAAFERRPNRAIPASTIQYDPGFVVSAPAELSIYLLQSEIIYFLRGKANYIPNKKIQSNYSMQMGTLVDSLSKLSFKLSKPINDTGIATLAKLMTVYNFCDSHLHPRSFLNYEGAELKKDIDSLIHFVNNFKSNDTAKSGGASLLSANNTLLAKKEALKIYESLLTELILTKQKIIAIIRQSYYNFDNNGYMPISTTFFNQNVIYEF